MDEQEQKLNLCEWSLNVYRCVCVNVYVYQTDPVLGQSVIVGVDEGFGDSKLCTDTLNIKIESTDNWLCMFLTG